jgi:UDP-glucose:glycoprotein glucosyltransferase
VYELGDSSSNPNPIIISSFHPKAIDLGPSRKIGKEDVDLQSMSDDDQSSPSQNAGLWGSIQGLLFSKDEKNKNVTDEKDYIHIFSLASGHLYERFLKIMMLSVTKQTKSPVKFWFIRQFLSPQFKNLETMSRLN